MKKKILILIRHYLPGYKLGGPLSSIVNLVSNLSDEFDFKVLTLDRDSGDHLPYEEIEADRWISSENCSVFYLSNKDSILSKIINQIKSSQSDVVYLNSVFDPLFSIGIILARSFGALKSQKIIVAARGELFEESLAFKRYKKAAYISFARIFKLYNNVIWHASTLAEKETIIKIFKADPNNVHIAINLPARLNYVDNEIEIGKFVPGKDIKELRLIFLARVSKEKNIPYAFDVLKMVKENVVFDIYGPIEDQYIWDECLAKIKELPANIEVNYKGSVSKDKVRETLQLYDVLFLPTFSENYGHSIVESLTVGTKVLISDKTPWRNLQLDKLGWDLSLAAPEQFVKAISDEAAVSSFERKENRSYIKTIFTKRLYDPKVIEATKELFYL